ncbi:MAG TPA: class I tRNA ligase family protein, partial [Minicystis sp.]|nr:class I tRNA ligase family protein [Minicystis sp.]
MASTLMLYDTLSAKLVPLVPKADGRVGVYCCGPTTYDVAHVGHARAALAPDILVRHLRGKGLTVTYVRNVTDVDDKILKRAEVSGEVPIELSARFAREYQKDMADLGCQKPDVEPRVSEHIADIVVLVQELIARGHAYPVTMKSGATDVYYAVRSFPSYGKLSKRSIDDLQVGARIEASD